MNWETSSVCSNCHYCEKRDFSLKWAYTSVSPPILARTASRACCSVISQSHEIYLCSFGLLLFLGYKVIVAELFSRSINWRHRKLSGNLESSIKVRERSVHFHPWWHQPGKLSAQSGPLITAPLTMNACLLQTNATYKLGCESLKVLPAAPKAALLGRMGRPKEIHDNSKTGERSLILWTNLLKTLKTAT